MKHLARELHDLFLGPREGDPFEQLVPRVCSVLLLAIVAAPYLVRCA